MTERDIITKEIAWYFHRHLLAELAKPASIMDETVFMGKTPRHISEGLLDSLLEEFPDVTSREPAPFNLIEQWSIRNGVIDYGHFSFEAYNIIFMERIMRLKCWDDEGSAKRYHDVIRQTHDEYDYRSRKWSPATFLTFENNMREVLREIVFSIDDVDHDEAWRLLFAESNEYQVTVSTFFEELLYSAYDASEELLHNILPDSIARELKETGKVQPASVKSATVLFADIVGFTGISESMSSKDLLQKLDHCYSLFDEVIDLCGLEKIKTIGDAYMCAGGITSVMDDHAIQTTKAAVGIRDVMLKLKEEDPDNAWEARIGLHTGPVIAGVIGKKKFSYDIWGDTVNTASRMESAGEPNRVNVSFTTYDCIKDSFKCEPRGLVDVKHKEPIEMYFVNSVI